jgi:hypothetical protein
MGGDGGGEEQVIQTHIGCLGPAAAAAPTAGVGPAGPCYWAQGPEQGTRLRVLGRGPDQGTGHEPDPGPWHYQLEVSESG